LPPHVEIDGHCYSTPYRLIRELVDVRIADKTVEIFHKGQRIASHARAPNRRGHSTITDHMLSLEKGTIRPPKPSSVTRSYFLPKLSRSDESRTSIGERGWNMAQFALGDVVRKNNGGDGVVRAIFTTKDGELTYAAEKERSARFRG
jgi:hypothetical protein